MNSTRHPLAALVLALAGATSWGATTLPPASHAYGFDGDLTDELGGPPMTAIKGTIEATDLKFKRGGGARVDGAARRENYSIEMRVMLSLEGGNHFYRLLDFKNRKSDFGLYVEGNSIVFVGGADGVALIFPPDTWVDVVITRDSATSEVVGYAAGKRQFSFIDINGIAIFVRPEGLTRAIFFQDDKSAPGDDCSGAVDHIRFFDRVLTAEEVKALDQGELPPNVTLQ
jgi:hypothetical protein